MLKSDYDRQLNSLFGEWKKKKSIWADGIESDRISFIEDGIVDFTQWEQLKPGKHVLFILKDVNDKTQSDWRLKDLLAEDCKYTMWRRVSEWARGILLTEATEPITKYLKFLNGLNAHVWLQKVAVMNLKKAAGGGAADMDEIMHYAEADKVEIRNEIRIIDPDIIICGGTCSAFNVA